MAAPEKIRSSSSASGCSPHSGTRKPGHLSSINQIAMHPAYQQIIGMGPAVIPLLLHGLDRTHTHWFWALTAITGENPVSREDRGNVPDAEAWVEWGRSRGFI